MQTRKRKLSTHPPCSDTITQGEELETFSNQDDEAKDPTFNPVAKKRRGNMTGHHRSLPESVKLELEKAALGKCCTLTLDPLQKPCSIEIVHVVPMATTPNFLRTLQEAWYTKDLPNVDSPANLMYLRVDWHRAFDEDLWAMLPTEELLLEIAGATMLAKKYSKIGDLFSKFSKCPEDKSSKDKYQFLWLGKSDSAMYPPLLRRKDPKTSNLDSDLVDTANGHDASVKLTELQTCNATLNTLATENKEFRARVTHLLSQSSTPSIALPEVSCNDTQAKLTVCQDNNSVPQLENAALQAQVDALFVEAKRLSLLDGMVEHETGTGYLRDSNSNPATVGDEVSKLLELTSRYRVFFPPYADFPAFHSHVHPFFAIVDAGAKLSGVDNPSQFTGAEIALDIYQQWLKLPCTLELPQVVEGEGDDDRDDDGQSAHTSQTGDSSSSLVSGSQGTGSHKSGCIASVNALGSHSLNEVDDLEDVDTFVSKWLARTDTGFPDEQEYAGDRKLDEYRKEPSQQAEPHQWQEWATTPPKMPGLLRDYHDTSRLTSYHWSLYHESVNLMAPTGSHRLSLNAETPYDPDVEREYDMYDLGIMAP